MKIIHNKLPIIFISDIHIEQDDNIKSTALQKLLLEINNIEAVYILGDLFNYWIGYDIAKQKLSKTLKIIKQINQKIPIYFCRGNKDALITPKCAQKIGFNLLEDHSKLDLFGQEVLITHGDSFCTLDTSYQKYIKFLKHPITANIFLKLPQAIRNKLATNTQKISQASKQNKNPKAMNVYTKDPKFCTAIKQCSIIHGHTHKQKIITSKQQHDRIVLGQWDKEISVLVFSKQGYKMLNQQIEYLNIKKINKYIQHLKN